MTHKHQDPRPGTYAVLLAPRTRGSIRIGRLGSLELTGGILVYVGSALGPGGVAARCNHHRRIATRPHWHLDYLRPHGRILDIWIAHGDERREHDWALALGRLQQAHYPMPGFGSSDCRCTSHLIWLPTAPDGETLAHTLGGGGWQSTPVTSTTELAS